MSEPSLRELQEWLKTVITTRGDLNQKLRQAVSVLPLDADDLVEGKRGLSARLRLNIYTTGYVLRLLECLKLDFPTLASFMGEQLFEIFAKAYIISLPSRSWSLFELGRNFPSFLLETRPPAETDSEAEASLLDLPAEIARFERLKTEVIYARGPETDPAGSARHFDPIDILRGDILVQTPPCLRLFDSPYPILDFLDAFERNPATPPPTKKTTFAGLTRVNYRLRLCPLEPWQHAFLRACAEPVLPLVAAGVAARSSGLETSAILARLLIWIPLALETGLLRSIETTPPIPGSSNRS